MTTIARPSRPRRGCGPIRAGRLVIVILALAAGVSAVWPQAQTARQLYEAVRKASFGNEKDALASRLGRLGTPESRQLLKQLLEDDHYWNREAAARAFLEFPSAESDGWLLEKLIDDHMIRDVIMAGFRKACQRTFPLLKSAYRRQTDEKAREWLLKTLAECQSPESEAILKEVVADAAASDRDTAFRLLIEHFPAGNAAYIKGFAGDPALRLPALEFLLQADLRENLPLFEALLRGDTDPPAHLLACQAVMKWAAPPRRAELFLLALRDGKETRVQGALLTFRGVRSPELAQQLERLVRQAQLAHTKVLAAVQLGDYPQDDVIPSLVLALREEFPEQEKSFIDYFGTAITAGLYSILSDAGHSMDKKAFAARQGVIAENLSKRAGLKMGPDYRKWLEWAVLRGLSVDGTNLIQFLYSGHPDLRRRAVEAACRLLGSKGRSDFLAWHAELANQSESALLLELTRALLEKGVLRDER